MPAEVVSKTWQATGGPAKRTAPGGKRMPFRPENIMTTLLITAVLSLVLLGIGGVTAIAIWGAADSTPPILYVLGTVILALKVFLGMLQTEASRREMSLRTQQVVAKVDSTRDTAREVAEKADQLGARVEQAQEEIKREVAETKQQVVELAKSTNGELTSAIHEAGEQARLAEKEQCIKDVLASPELFTLIMRAATAAVEGFYQKASDSGLRLPKIE